MEQQKLLWTILSVGILVLILLGAGMFFFLPSDSTGLAQNGKTTEWSKAAAPVPEQKAPEIKKTPVQPAATAQTPVPDYSADTDQTSNHNNTADHKTSSPDTDYSRKTGNNCNSS